MDNSKNINEPKRASRASNIIALAVCFVIAFLVWFYVMQTESPEYEETFVRVPVAVENVNQLTSVSKLSVISGWDHTASLTVKGRKSDIAKINENDLKLYVDVSGLDVSGEKSVEVKAVIPGALQLVSVSPATVTVVVDEVITKKVPVYATVNQAKYDVDSELGEPKTTPEFVEVTGPKSALEKIESAKVSLALGDVTASVVAVAPFELVDDKGEKTENPYVRTDVQSVTVTIPLYTTKTVPLSVDSKYGYFNSENSNVTVIPSVLVVKGEHSLVSALDTIHIATLDEKLDDQMPPTYFEIPFPDGIVSVNGTTSARVELQHVHTKTLTITGINASNVRLDNSSGEFWYVDECDTEITVRGEAHILDRLSAENVRLAVKIDSSMASGDHVLNAIVEITLPEGAEGTVYEIGEYKVRVKSAHK